MVFNLILYAVYVLTQDGKPAIYKHYKKASAVSEVTLMSKLLDISSWFTDLLENEKCVSTTIEFLDFKYHLKNFFDYIIIIVSDEDKIKPGLFREIAMEIETQTHNRGISLRTGEYKATNDSDDLMALNEDLGIDFKLQQLLTKYEYNMDK